MMTTKPPIEEQEACQLWISTKSNQPERKPIMLGNKSPTNKDNLSPFIQKQLQNIDWRPNHQSCQQTRKIYYAKLLACNWLGRIPRPSHQRTRTLVTKRENNWCKKSPFSRWSSKENQENNGKQPTSTAKHTIWKYLCHVQILFSFAFVHLKFAICFEKNIYLVSCELFAEQHIAIYAKLIAFWVCYFSTLYERILKCSILRAILYNLTLWCL